MNCIEIRHLSVSYRNGEALQDVSVAVENGDYVGIVGPNGSGKTTLIKTLLGLVPVSSGTIEIFGIDHARFTDWPSIGYLPQKQNKINQLFPATVSEVVSLGLMSQKRFPKRLNGGDHERIALVLGWLGIADLRDRLINTLSGGQQQRVFLARAMVNNPRILILDEPTVALDPQSRDKFYEIVDHINKKHGITILLVTHDSGTIGQYASKLLYLDKKVIFYGSFDGFCDSPEMTGYFGAHAQHQMCHRHETH